MLEKSCVRDKYCLKLSKLTQKESIAINNWWITEKNLYDCWHYFFSLNLPGMTTTVGMTAAVRTRAMSSPSPSPSSPWAWASSSSPKHLNPPRLPQQPYPLPVTLATACSPCHSAWVYALIMTRAGCTFMTLTLWGAFTRGRWIVQEQCIQLLVSWAAARFNWKSLSPPRDWLSEEMMACVAAWRPTTVWSSACLEKRRLLLTSLFCRLGSCDQWRHFYL